jgi:hypothetical protein
MKQEHIQTLAKVCQYVANAEKSSFEEHIANGGNPDDHIYSLVIESTHILMNAHFDSH